MSGFSGRHGLRDASAMPEHQYQQQYPLQPLAMPGPAALPSLGMAYTAEDFDHPALPANHLLARHCLYRLRRACWLDTDAAVAR